jgi:hypothetical protein
LNTCRVLKIVIVGIDSTVYFQSNYSTCYCSVADTDGFLSGSRSAFSNCLGPDPDPSP